MWLAFALSCPLFGVSHWRFRIFSADIAIPMVILALLLAMAFFSMITHPIRIFPRSGLQKTLFILFILFLAWHGFGWIQSEHHPWATKVIIKLSYGMLLFWLIQNYFPRNREFLALFWKIILGSSALLVFFYIYKYVFVFKYDFLGSNWFEPTPSDKGHLAWYLMPIVLYSLFYFWDCKNKIAFFPFLFIFITGWLYICSRGAWISVLLGILSVAPLVKFKRLATYLATILLVVSLSWIFLKTNVTAVELQFPRRLLFLVSPESTPEFQTYEVRSSLIQRGLAHFRTSPITGIGIGDADCLDHAEHIPFHNDYVTVMADLGLIGLALFLAIHAIFGIKILWNNYRGRAAHFSWLSLGSHALPIAIASSFLYVNVYTSPFLWILLGLCWFEHETAHH